MRKSRNHANSFYVMEVPMMYNAVGIDISKGKSTVAFQQPRGLIVRKLFYVSHTTKDLKDLTGRPCKITQDIIPDHDYAAPERARIRSCVSFSR